MKAINLFKTKRVLERKDQETDEAIKIFKILMMYINRDEFREGISYMEQANKESEKTIEKLSNMRTRMNTHIDNAIKSQTSIKEHLGHAKELIEKLRKLLNNSS